MALYKEHDLVKRKISLGSADMGVIVMVYPQQPHVYEVEFIDSRGRTEAVETLYEEEWKQTLAQY